MDINLTTLFEDFYHTRFFVCICLSMFTFLFSLRLDEVIKCSYWIIFAPLWIWKLTALVGIVVGTVFWIRLSHRRFERDTFIQFKSMLITFLTLTILFLFELITCDKLDGGRSQPSWSVCFVPLFILSVLSIAICIWSIRYDRSYEIELICSLNILQFVFIALRLDNTITWSWILVLVPVWIIMSIAMIVLLYIIILTIVMRKTNQSLAHHHNHHKPKHRWTNCILYVLFIFSLLTFEILLTNKLDQEMMPGMGASSSSGSSNPSALSPSLLSLGVIGPPAQSAASASQPSSPSSNSVNIIAHLPNIPNIISINMPPPTSRDSQPQQQQQQLQPSAPSNFLFSNSQSLQQNYYGPSNKSSAIHRSPLPTSASISASSSSSSTTHLNLSYFQVSLPLYLVYLSLILLSLNNHSGNTMWFGMRRDFCDYFLVVCPVFKTYGNVQIKWSFHGDNSNDQLMNNNGNGGTNGETGRNRASNATSRHSNTNRSQPSRLNRSNETSLMTFNLAPNSANQSNRGAANNNNPSTHNCISLSLLEAGNQPLSNQHPQSMTSADDNESALVIEVDSVSIANPLMASQQQQQQPPIAKSSKKQSKSKRKQQQRDQQQQQQTSSGRFNRQFSIPSYISNAYSDRTSLKSFYLINNQTTVNSSILNGAGSSAFAIKKSNKVGKIIQLDVPD